MPDIVLPLMLAAFFVLGAIMLASPLTFYRRFYANVYKEEFLNRFTTRVMGRALGVLFMMFCLGASASFLRKEHPGVSDRLFTALGVLFALVWVSGLLLGIVTWISPVAKTWTESHATDRITGHENRIEIAVGVAVVLAAAIWAVLALIGPV
jgi:hypothetical protein